jgi:hypothetical protein
MGGPRGNNIKNNNPGPGSYDTKPKTKAPTYVMSGRPQVKKPDPVPGPGQYTAEKSEKQPTMVKMIRKDERPWTSSVVGPGSYEVKDKKEKRGGKFTKDVRKNEILKHPSEKNPGPGAYTQTMEKVNASTPSFSYSSCINYLDLHQRSVVFLPAAKEVDQLLKWQHQDLDLTISITKMSKHNLLAGSTYEFY